jgi:hypothetical protein
MARRKTLPESLRAKMALAERLSALRQELYGDRGGPEMARRLGIPVRTWYNYESGVTVPAEVVLRIIELTGVEPVWLLHGKGPKYRAVGSAVRGHSVASGLVVGSESGVTVGALLRTALQLLENETPPSSRGEDNQPATSPHTPGQPLAPQARREWIQAQLENRLIHVSGNAMAPIVADGAAIAFSPTDEDPIQLDGKLVVVWLDGQPLVRWFQHCGRYGLLRAENPQDSSSQRLVELDDPANRPRIRRVLWIDTPH